MLSPESPTTCASRFSMTALWWCVKFSSQRWWTAWTSNCVLSPSTCRRAWWTLVLSLRTRNRSRSWRRMRPSASRRTYRCPNSTWKLCAKVSPPRPTPSASCSRASCTQSSTSKGNGGSRCLKSWSLSGSSSLSPPSRSSSRVRNLAIRLWSSSRVCLRE